VKYVLEQQQGFSFARNAGIQVACADLIAFCDDDVYVAPDWVQKMYENLIRFPDADFVGGKVLPAWETEPPKWLGATCPLWPYKIAVKNPWWFVSRTRFV
jgi:glucosyl-dolichyl phosphate glucuronosyltransferase